ncbi:hypothetical protein [Roseisolibacter sp. H3M3-2]|uniref:hypothetical protein n=1 Tax=Roseisolibacter sp. H3M3-2 TaxID=3031323 RepID=UPI0023DAC79B|nr:hypothetical protein [Roseisolibacter sp. H3M3-2]MDF1505823.1 hypothetical protein [Roseisolibacter sp. H3M3-2]
MRRLIAPLLVAAQLAACGRADAPSHDAAPIAVGGPTLVGYLIATQAEVDADDELATVAEDFQFHLADARDSLVRRGVAVHARTTSPIVYRVDGRTARFRPAADSEGVGYLWLRPGRAPVRRFGVMTDADLVAFTLDSLRWRDARGGTPSP